MRTVSNIIIALKDRQGIISQKEIIKSFVKKNELAIFLSRTFNQIPIFPYNLNMSQQDQNDLVEIDKRQMYVIQRILKRRVTKKGTLSKIQYFVKWKNYDHSQNTWQPAQNLSTVPDMVQKFEKKLAEKKMNQGHKQLSKNAFYGQESQQNVSQNSQRYERQNGHKLRKQQSGSKRIEVNQSIKQVKQEVSLTRQNQKQSRQLPRKNRNNESVSEFSSKNISYIQIDDKDDVKVSKNQETKSNKQKQIKGDSTKDDKDKKQKAIPKRQESYGKIVNHIYRDGKLYYQVQKISKNQKVLKIQQISNEQVERSCLQGAYQYLQKLLVSLQQARN